MYGGGYSPMGGGGGFMGSSPMMGAPMMGVMPAYQQQRGSSFGSGLMTNLFAGFAGYQLAKAFSGGSGYQHRDREVIIINNGPAQSNSTAAQQPEVPFSQQAPPNQLSPVAENPGDHEAPQQPANNGQDPQFMPASNEYNFWGLPQYGIPLYGYNLPSQITDYYKVDRFMPQ